MSATVKPIQWREVAWRDGLETRKEPFHWEGEWPADRWKVGVEGRVVNARYYDGLQRGTTVISEHLTVEEAKAAAQADYERRLLPVIEPNADLVAALTFYRDNFKPTPNKLYGGLEYRPTEALLEDCGNRAADTLRAITQTQKDRK